MQRNQRRALVRKHKAQARVRYAWKVADPELPMTDHEVAVYIGRRAQTPAIDRRWPTRHASDAPGRVQRMNIIFKELLNDN